MRTTAIVTLTDRNIINQNALILLVKSLLSRFFADSHIFVLLPLCQAHSEFLNLLSNYRIHLRQYPYEEMDDPYAVKFLLSNFVQGEGTVFDNILYLDPDHIVLDSFSLIPQERALYVSSEVQHLRNFLLNDEYNLSGNILSEDALHYNTSLIYGKRDCWLRALDACPDKYIRIKNFVSFRHREELAFCFSAITAGLELIPVSVSTQSYFGRVDKRCKIFHYGGEYHETHRIKRAIGDRLGDFSNLYGISSTCTETEAWIAQEITRVIDIVPSKI